MASLSTGADGLHKVYFKAADGKRQCLYCGRIPKKTAEGIQRAVTELERAAQYGHTPADFAFQWLSEAGDDIHSKLVKHGLAAPRAVVAPTVVTLGGLVERYQSRPKWKKLKPSTQLMVARAIYHLLQHFDPTTPIKSITSAQARDFYDQLLLSKDHGGAGLAVATANLTASVASAMFFYAVDAELLDRNHFRKLPRGTRRGNNTMVSAEVAKQVLAHIHGTEDRLVFGLARWGGLRTISEQRGLVWSDVDWENRRLLVRSPKTERHEGKESRLIPLFPEIAKLLEERFNEAAEGEEHILPSYRHANHYKPSTMLRAALRRAGVKPWSRLYHSLRASRQSELAELYPAHVCSEWLGNSVQVGEKHYLMVTPEHFAKASEPLHNPLQPAPAKPRQQETSRTSDGA